MKNSTDLEHGVIDTLIDSGPKQAGEMDKNTVHSLHQRGLIYLDVPINFNDYISGNALL